VECLFADFFGNSNAALSRRLRQLNPCLARTAKDVNDRADKGEEGKKYCEDQQSRKHFTDVVNLKNYVTGKNGIGPFAP